MLSITALLPRMLKPSASAGKGNSVSIPAPARTECCVTLTSGQASFLQARLNHVIFERLTDIDMSCRLSLEELYFLDEVLGCDLSNDSEGDVNLVFSSFQLSCFQQFIVEQKQWFYSRSRTLYEGRTGGEISLLLDMVNIAMKMGVWLAEYDSLHVLFTQKVKG